jgi:hypothetical protein
MFIAGLAPSTHERVSNRVNRSKGGGCVTKSLCCCLDCWTVGCPCAVLVIARDLHAALAPSGLHAERCVQPTRGAA